MEINNHSTNKENIKTPVQNFSQRLAKKKVSYAPSPNLETPIKRPQNRFKVDDFCFGKKMGQGKFGRVYMCKHKGTGDLIAIKVFEKERLLKYDFVKQFRREIEIHQHLTHENIIGFRNFFWDEKRVYITLEFAVFGSVYSVLQRQEKTRFKNNVASRFIYETSLALDYMHSKNVIHRDLKPENLLLDHNYKIKLADFGWAIHTSSKRVTMCGTLDYLAPELVARQKYTHEIDNWGLGILTYELLCGVPPFESSDGDGTKKLIANCHLRFPTHVCIEAKGMITKLLDKMPGQRLELKNLPFQPWIKKYKPFWTNSLR
eukprot:maker-scaffold_31-snap-gene-1.0-mRNA-1 protein AED:0.04 eAED:0.04 QI:77/1/1/1/1/1/4/105/316